MIAELCVSQSGQDWEGKMRSDLFPVRLAGAGSGDSRTSGHLDQPPLWRLTAGRNWRDKCVSPGRTCLSGGITRPD